MSLKKDQAPLDGVIRALCPGHEFRKSRKEMVQFKIQLARDRPGFFTANPGLILGAAGSTTQTGEF
jgi:hypothetical protein